MKKDPSKKLAKLLKVLFWIWLTSLIIGLGFLVTYLIELAVSTYILDDLHSKGFPTIIIIGFYYYLFATVIIYPLGTIIDLFAIKKYFSLTKEKRLPHKKKLITLSILFQLNLLIANSIAAFFMGYGAFLIPFSLPFRANIF